MARKTFRTVPYRRKRDKATDYKKRRNLLVSGKTRLVVRRSNKHIIAQLVQYKDTGDKVIKAAHSQDLAKFGWKAATGSVPAAYLTGYLLGMRAKGDVSEAILDMSMYTSVKGSRIYAVAKGFREAGIGLPASDEVFPDDDRCAGKHIETYAASLKEKDASAYEKRFSAVIKQGADPAALSEQVSSVKEKITNDAK